MGYFDCLRKLINASVRYCCRSQETMKNARCVWHWFGVVILTVIIFAGYRNHCFGFQMTPQPRELLQILVEIQSTANLAIDEYEYSIMLTWIASLQDEIGARKEAGQNIAEALQIAQGIREAGWRGELSIQIVMCWLE